MLTDFRLFIEKHKLFEPGQELLVAVSGGADSMVLLHLLMMSGYKVSVAHCNFQLRGTESDDDEKFVEQIAHQFGLPFYSIRFNTLEYVKTKKISLEMAARELRYEWFNGLLKKHQLLFIVTGHHLNDSIETLLLNLCRGTGINGLKGIAPLNGNVARPLLFATRDRIESYARVNNIAWRTDSTNLSDNFLRNIIRRQVIPGMKQVNPNFEERMMLNFDSLNQAATIYNDCINDATSEVVKTHDERIEVDFSKLLQHRYSSTILFEIMQNYGFNLSQTERLLQMKTSSTGKQFYSGTHQLIVDRDKIIIEKITENTFNHLEIDHPQEIINEWIHLKMKVIQVNEFELNKNPDVACLDYQKLTFPLKIRLWKNGDTFHPLGMTRQKKISDFLIDKKVDRLKKQKVMVMTCAENIVWLMGFRIDNNYSVTAQTKTVLVIEMIA